MKQKQIRHTRMRTQFAATFFGIIILFMGTLFALSYGLSLLGVSAAVLHNPIHALLAVVALSFLLATVMFYFIVHKVFKPLEQMTKASKQVAKGNYTVQVSYDGKVEELSHMFHNFNRMVQELNSVEMIRNDFTANVSHEFRTPLSSITGYVTLLQDPELTEEERKEYIQKIFFNIEKLGDLTENILRLSKLEHQAYLEPPVTYRLDEQIREAIVLLEPKWGRKGIGFDLDLPEITYTGQQALLFQVWMNLLSNAIKFSQQEGTVTVRLKEQEDSFEVLFSDDGIGMSKETMTHIFDKFYQGDTSHRSQGNGLGLALCKEIIDRCDGKIYVTSQPGHGSVFMVRLMKS